MSARSKYSTAHLEHLAEKPTGVEQGETKAKTQEKQQDAGPEYLRVTGGTHPGRVR
jgi:hypothetical protein